MKACTCCGEPTHSPETHHHNHRKADNDPDNLRTVDRRHHMEHHENDRAVEDHTEQRFGPPTPTSLDP